MISTRGADSLRTQLVSDETPSPNVSVSYAIVLALQVIELEHVP